MNQILICHWELRWAGLFVLGACAGSLINLGVYRLAWHPRAISPWSRPAAGAPRRRWTDHVPILGWLGLRREAALHGSGFWVRPMLVELLTGIGWVALYWWEIDRQGLLSPVGLPRPLPPSIVTVLCAQLACHLVLISLMLAGSLIDADEKTIPDWIAVPGTLFGLLAAAVYPASLLPDQVRLLAANVRIDPMMLTSPNHWPACLAGFPHTWSLALALGCWWLWCVALMPRTWYARHGWRRAVGLLAACLIRDPATWRILAMGLAGSAGIAVTWCLGGRSWIGLLTALVGAAAGGGLIWLVRVVGTAVLRREAMGFGDVTLMAMIGAFLGWQACLIVFFLAPFGGLLIGLPILIFRRESEIPYGPFLCLAALVVIVRWAALWEWLSPIFSTGLMVPLLTLFCMALMGVLLGVWRLAKSVLP